jgi:uncharacterized coiled-coil DUF342 family protein
MTGGRQNNLVELKKQKNNIIRKVKEKREEIINFLNKLERKMLDNISIIESKTGQQIKKLIEELNVKQQEAKTVASKSSIIIMSLHSL